MFKRRNINPVIMLLIIRLNKGLSTKDPVKSIETIGPP
jgi:hypothetical protein